MIENKLTPMMIEHFNLKMEMEGSCLRYVEGSRDGNIIPYDLAVKDKYISLQYTHSINVTEEFEQIVRDFFKSYDVIDLGYSNTVKSIFAEVQ